MTQLTLFDTPTSAPVIAPNVPRNPSPRNPSPRNLLPARLLRTRRITRPDREPPWTLWRIDRPWTTSRGFITWVT